ncbi:MAG TPA: hypothetical protein VG755_42115 [Nannocystaceae bacterium]|nr:hypothetical protein [Nannocystaceae bacterium]
MTGDPLLDALDEHGVGWARRATARVLANPFWEERFGDRAQPHSHDDGQYHLRYLVLALRLEEPELFAEYARWLRDLLVARRMCSRHLAQHFAAFADELSEAAPSGVERALEVLAVGQRGLARRDGVASRIEAIADELALAVSSVLLARNPAWAEKAGAAVRCADDIAYHLSYLADAAATGQVSSFRSYIDFIAGFLARRGVGRIELDACLDELGAQLRTRLSDDEWNELAPLFGAARGVVA